MYHLQRSNFNCLSAVWYYVQWLIINLLLIVKNPNVLTNYAVSAPVVHCTVPKFLIKFFNRLYFLDIIILYYIWYKSSSTPKPVKWFKNIYN